MNADAAVVFDEAEFAEAVHEEADAGAGGADHFGEGFLGDFGDEGLLFAGFSEFGHEEEDSGEAFFAGVEELIDEIGLGSHAAGEEKGEEQVGEGVLFVHDADHLGAVDAEGVTGCDGGGGGEAESGGCGEGFLSDEVARIEEGDGGLFAGFGDYGEFRAAFLEVEDGVGGGSLGKDGGFGFELDDLASYTGVGKEGRRIESWRHGGGHRDGLFLAAGVGCGVESVVRGGREGTGTAGCAGCVLWVVRCSKRSICVVDDIIMFDLARCGLRGLWLACILEHKMTTFSSRFWFTFRYWRTVAASAE